MYSKTTFGVFLRCLEASPLPSAARSLVRGFGSSAAGGPLPPYIGAWMLQVHLPVEQQQQNIGEALKMSVLPDNVEHADRRSWLKPQDGWDRDIFSPIVVMHIRRKDILLVADLFV